MTAVAPNIMSPHIMSLNISSFSSNISINKQAENYCRSLGTLARALMNGRECPSCNYFPLVPNPTSLIHSGEWQLGQPQNAWFLLLAALLLIVMLMAAVWRVHARSRFAQTDTSPARSRFPAVLARRLSSLALLLATILICAALMDIRFGKISQSVPQRGIEVVFALDVSRSMLAEDVRPNRLDRAKQMINDTMEAMNGDSAGLVIFAGEAKQVIPVTNHRDEFRERLQSVSTDDVMRGGSRLGDAIRVSSNAFLSTSSDTRVIVMLTDGEDMESKPIEAARQSHDQQNITIFTIGLGDTATGARIPKQNTAGRQFGIRENAGPASFTTFDGQEVWSKLDGEVLKKIASVSGGDYVPAGTKQVDMQEFYDAYLDALPDTLLETREIDSYAARYQWFLFPAVVLLFLSAMIGRPV